MPSDGDCRKMEIFTGMDGCFVIGLELNLLIQSPTLLTLFESFISSSTGA
jgi:hypothetical protein